MEIDQRELRAFRDEINRNLASLHKDNQEHGKFRKDIYERLEMLHGDLEHLTTHVVQIKTTLYGANGEPGKLRQLDGDIEENKKAIKSNGKTIERIKAWLWPIVGAIVLLGWIGLPNVGKLLR